MGVRRQVFRGMFVAATLVMATILSAPWWIPASVSAVGRHLGASVGSWEKEALLMATYRDLSYQFPGGTVTIGELQAPLLGVWPRAAVSAKRIIVRLEPVEREPEAPREEVSIHQILSTVAEIWPQLEEWLANARVDDLTVVAGTATIQLSTVRWDRGVLALAGTLPAREESFQLSLRRNEEGDFVAEGRIPTHDASWNLVAGLEAEETSVAVAVQWTGNTARAEARFGTEGMLPSSALVSAASLRVPSELAGLSGYGPLEGDVRLLWDGSRYSGAVQASAAPAEAQSPLPPVEVDLRAVGDFGQVLAESANLRAPGIQAALSSPLAWEFSAGVPLNPARFDLAIDVAKLPWVEGEGLVRGTIDVSRSADGQPLLAFQLNGEQLTWRDLAGAGFDVEGSMRGPLLAIDRLEAKVGEESRLSAHGRVDLNTRKVGTVEVSLRVDHGGVAAWVPDGPAFGTVEIRATADGPVDALAHESDWKILGLQGAPGGDLDARLKLKGTGLESATLEGVVESAAGIEIPVKATLARGADRPIDVVLDRLAWNGAEGTWWSLAEPVKLQFSLATEEGRAMTVELGEMSLLGEAFALKAKGRVQWPGQGRLSVNGERIAVDRLAGIIPEEFERGEIEYLDLEAEWSDGPVVLAGAARVSYSVDDYGTYAVEAGFQTSENRRAMAADLKVLANSSVVLEGRGQAPLELAGRQDGFVARLPQDGTLALELASQPNPDFWRSITELTQWTVTDPALSASIAGTLEQPRGQIRFSTRELQPPRNDGQAMVWPRLGDISLVLTADNDGIALEEALMTVQHAWIHVDGRASWETWRTLQSEGKFAWRDTSFSFASNPIPVAIASRAFPTVLAPAGSLSFDLEHEPDGGLTGRAWLHGASLRPVAPFGSVREINAELRFNEYHVTLPALNALVGGRPVEFSGRGSLEPGKPPEFALRAYSEGVPLLRDSGLVVRAAVDVEVKSRDDAPVEITGEVNLGPSVFVSDIASLVPAGGVTAPEQRPPYFSVKDDPFSAWKLDVALKGDEFLRIESPLFQGLLSADFRLEGTLGEPKAIGRVTSQKGTIVFPFATVQLQNLEASLSRENPYEPRVMATGGTRVFGYDVRMEVSGSASEPRLLFSADPPLSSQQVFLMLSTGELPESEFAFSTSERAQRLAFFLGKKLASDFGLGGSGGGDSRLSVRSGENFTREGRETMYVQYDLTRRWSLVGEYDRFDAYNGGIKFRLINR